VQQVSYGPLIMSIMLIMSCYTGFFNVRRGKNVKKIKGTFLCLAMSDCQKNHNLFFVDTVINVHILTQGEMNALCRLTENDIIIRDIKYIIYLMHLNSTNVMI